MCCAQYNFNERDRDASQVLLYEQQLNSLYLVSEKLSQSFELNEMLDGVLTILHETADMHCGMLLLVDQEGKELYISAVHTDREIKTDKVRYRQGEGILGTILAKRETVTTECVATDPRFLDRLGLYDISLPFIGVPVTIGNDAPIGVLAAQPASGDLSLLELRARLMEMIANLIARYVQLALKISKEKDDLTDERDRLRREVRSNYSFDNIVGHTDSMEEIFEQVRQVAKWNTTVLVRGESGTGKELIANAIHYNSPRAGDPFIKLNCAALPDNLLESELFGHEKGGFTGAVSQRKGRFELAHRGTLFLDEIGEISPVFQAKLLRVLQEGEFERVGGTKTLNVDVRIIAATNRDLETEVEEGSFREDLFYRLNVMPIYVPPLRNRREDIPMLAQFLVSKLAKSQGRELTISEGALRILSRYDWPGNVREMENCLERASVMCKEGDIDVAAISMTGIEENMAPVFSNPQRPSIDIDDPELDEREKVIAALEQTGWVQAKAARLLGMTPRQIAYRIQTLNIKVKRI